MVKYESNINRITHPYIRTSKMNADLNKELEKITSKIKERVSKEIPDTGYFRSFAENFEKGYKPDLFCKNIALFVQRDEQRDGRAFLGISVLHPTMNKQISTYIVNGDRNSILKYINDENFNKEFETTVLKLSKSLEEI